jgi:hypothetical protein
VLIIVGRRRTGTTVYSSTCLADKTGQKEFAKNDKLAGFPLRIKPKDAKHQLCRGKKTNFLSRAAFATLTATATKL